MNNKNKKVLLVSTTNTTFLIDGFKTSTVQLKGTLHKTKLKLLCIIHWKAWPPNQHVIS